MYCGAFFCLKFRRKPLLILKEDSPLPSITDPDILKLLTLRLTQLALTFPHQLIILEPDDIVEDLEKITGYPILKTINGDHRSHQLAAS